MPERCTCGATLASDAIFCHKCGKPQRTVDAPEMEAPPPVEFVAPVAAHPPAASEPLPLNFRNPLALKIASLVALIATFLSFLPYLNWLAAGYFAVFFYRRRTGSALSVGTGVRMGWITGVLMFTIIAGLLVLFKAAGGVEVLQVQLKNAADPRFQDMLKILQSGTAFMGLLMELFFFITCLSMAGGALGAKMVGRG